MRWVVVLLNFGGPRNLDEVEPFLSEILRDPNTLQLPFPRMVQDWLARRVSRRRTPEIRRQYGEIGGRSPIVEDTGRIADALRRSLAENISEIEVHVAHRYLPGHALETARRIQADGASNGDPEELAVLALPCYPHFSYATTGSALQQLREVCAKIGLRGVFSVLRSYPDAPGYLEALSDRLRTSLEQSGATPAETVILCSAHGLPEVYVERGDPYRLELYRTVEGLRSRFPEWRFELSFQSRVGPMEWLKPYTDRIIPELGAEGVRHLVFVPLSFVNDHIETLYEIDHTYFELAKKSGMTPHRAVAISDHPHHIAVLRDAVMAWRAGHGGVPLAELLPPEQYGRRAGRYLWAIWWAALMASLILALCG